MRFLLVSLVLLFSQLTMARRVSIDLTDDVVGNQAPRWSFYTSFAGRTSIESNKESRSEESLAMDFMPSYRLTPATSLRAYFLVTKDMQEEQENQIQDAFVGMTTKWAQLTKASSLLTEVRLVAPLSEVSREDESLRGRLFAAVINNNSLNIPYTQGANLMLRAQAVRSFHEFESFRNGPAGDGEVNTQYSVGVFAGLNVFVTEKFSAFAYFSNSIRYSYEGTRKADVFEMGQSVSYVLYGNTFMTVGHTLGGWTFADNGVSNNIELFNQDDSTVFASIATTF